MWLNTVDYTTLQLALCLIGSALWVGVYVEIIRSVHRNRFLEMPVIVVAGNFAWEMLYSWFFNSYINLGDLLLWGYRAWFLLDIYIVWLALRYGEKQFESLFIRRNLKPLFFILFAGYVGLMWTGIASGLDNMPLHGDGTVKLGGISAYVLNIIISLGYIHLYLHHRTQYGFNTRNAWMKGVGTFCFTIFFALVDGQNYFLLCMAGIVTVLDVAYIVLQHRYPSIHKQATVSGTPHFVANPNFERLWQAHPEAQSWYERGGVKLRQLSFERWCYASDDRTFSTDYWVIEGCIIRQVSEGVSNGPIIRNTTDCLRGILTELELQFKPCFLFSDASRNTGGDLDSRRVTVELFSEPRYSQLRMYLIANRFVRASLAITFPINPDVMNSWKVFADEDSAWASLMQNFIAGGAKRNVAGQDLQARESQTAQRLRQVYDVLAKISDNNIESVDTPVLPDDDPFSQVFDALGMVLDDKRQQMSSMKSINDALHLQNIALEAERQRAEALLLNVLPATIAQRLKNGERSIADHHESVSILFADIVGFTPLAARQNPRHVVEWLNDLYSRFDRISQELGIERIKTIGDAYMAVSGAPERCDDHAERILRLAFGIREESKRFSQQIGESIVMRIGINTGEVVGAVVGESKFAYDLWGDSVNTAARMESQGEPGKIQVTEDFRTALESLHISNGWMFVPRPPMEIKGKGVMKTYFLEKT